MLVMLKIIYRSVLKELITTFVLTLAFLNSVLMMEKILRLSKLLSGIGASVFDMAKIILYLQPQLLLLTIPMSLLLSTLLVYGRMNQDSEIIILKTSGMDFRKIALPVILLGLLSFFTSIAVSFALGPESSLKLRNEITKIIAVGSTQAIEEGTFNTSFKNIVILVKGRKPPDMLKNIFIYDSRNKEEPRVLMAKEGRLFVQDGPSIGLDLTDGYINIMRSNITTELFFDRYRFSLVLESDSHAPKKAEFTPFELLKKAAEELNPRDKTALYLEFHRRLSLPAVCLVLIFLGPPLSLIAGKSGRLGGLAIGLLVFTVYYMSLIYGENMVTTGLIPHYVGAWATTAVLGLFAFFLFKIEASK
jgi:lipopolysaccharide export system permease protein